MDSVRRAARGIAWVLHRVSCPFGTRTSVVVRRSRRLCRPIRESLVLDVIYLLATMALFALVACIAKGAEKL